MFWSGKLSIWKSWSRVFQNFCIISGDFEFIDIDHLPISTKYLFYQDMFLNILLNLINNKCAKKKGSEKNKNNQKLKTQSLKISYLPTTKKIEDPNHFLQKIYTYLIEYIKTFWKHARRSTSPFCSVVFFFFFLPLNLRIMQIIFDNLFSVLLRITYLWQW